ncbi:hypothetical protein BDB00DRAFT_766072 [Zychaea mexicana]|uniref:uncharacterized protein n=1 Tax=Zychaea mexicana TaxID=64656 RepID=UPI0022FECD4E|nr:uncharacterized protein BDB00DRAFT_766072 [Zychaea mexicana]KAI9492101.1 hypothetical protein BDB00DRAFT_766072 [Zychaea mexicana]
MDLARLKQALQQLPIDTLLSEIPEVQNSIAHLLKSNEAMREFDPKGEDRDLTEAIEENQALMERHENRIDLTLRVIKERLGEAAAYEVGSNVDAFRKEHPTKPVVPENQKQQQEQEQEEGVFL